VFFFFFLGPKGRKIDTNERKRVTIPIYDESITNNEKMSTI